MRLLPLRLAAAPLMLAFLAAASAQSPGVISLTLDATQAPLKVLHTAMRMPVKPGPLTLYYPKWIPGEHEPDGPIGNVAGLHFTGNGQPIPWSRDPLDVFTFHLTIPAGVSELEVSFDYLEIASGRYTSGSSSTDKLVDINWNQDVLYPAGTPAHDLMVEPTLILPPDWQFGTALPFNRRNGSQIAFKTVNLTTLIDSPVIAGEYYRAVNITPPGEPIHHELDMVADSPEALALPDNVKLGLINLVAETGKLFGSRHYRDYHFLLTLSDHVPHFGLEHHESDDSRLPERALLGPDAARIVGELLPHEFIHSWNGKFRRPQDLASAPYQAPMQDDMLWVYEGLTDFLGNLEATRAGLWSDAEYRQWLADIAAEHGPGRPGRTWRPLIDTAVAVPGMFENGNPQWQSWLRGMDYYDEGDLLWLEVAAIIHDQSHGSKSIEDFLRLFFGAAAQGPTPMDGAQAGLGPMGSPARPSKSGARGAAAQGPAPINAPELKTYTFDDLVAALDQVAPYDWAGYFHRRLTSLSAQPPLGGIEAGGWKYVLDGNGVTGAGVLAYSIGLQVKPDGTVLDSLIDEPAYKAGVIPGMRIIGVNGRLFTMARLQQVVMDSPRRKAPIELLVSNDDDLRTCLVDYHGGPVAPHLVRDESKPDYLDQLLRPLAQ